MAQLMSVTVLVAVATVASLAASALASGYDQPPFPLFPVSYHTVQVSYCATVSLYCPKEWLNSTIASHSYFDYQVPDCCRGVCSFWMVQRWGADPFIATGCSS